VRSTILCSETINVEYILRSVKVIYIGKVVYFTTRFMCAKLYVATVHNFVEMAPIKLQSACSVPTLPSKIYQSYTKGARTRTLVQCRQSSFPHIINKNRPNPLDNQNGYQNIQKRRHEENVANSLVQCRQSSFLHIINKNRPNPLDNQNGYQNIQKKAATRR